MVVVVVVVVVAVGKVMLLCTRRIFFGGVSVVAALNLLMAAYDKLTGCVPFGGARPRRAQQSPSTRAAARHPLWKKIVALPSIGELSYEGLLHLRS